MDRGKGHVKNVERFCSKIIVMNFVKIVGMPCIISIRAIPVVNTAYTKER